MGGVPEATVAVGPRDMGVGDGEGSESRYNENSRLGV